MSSPIIEELNQDENTDLLPEGGTKLGTMMIEPSRSEYNARSIDSFLDEASQAFSHLNFYSRIYVQRHYWYIILSCGVCNSSDATEILALSYILGLDASKSDFVSVMLDGDLSKNGGILASVIFIGMLIGGIFVGILGDSFGR